MPKHQYIYASLRTGHNKADLMKNFQNTKLYSDYIYIVNFMKSKMFDVPDDETMPDESLITNNMSFNPDKTCQIDIMTSTRNGMYYKLDCIIEQAKQSYGYNTMLAVTSLNAFGLE